MPDYASPEAIKAAGGSNRFSETAKLLPVLFVIGNIVGLWCIYMWCHCLRLWKIPERHDDAVWQIAIFNSITVMLLLNYVQCIMVHPGTIPSKLEDPKWEYIPDGKTPAEGGLQEMKKTGERRSCRWCGKFKPDRTHHCRVCRTCILKMDHHCPWIYNCVGFRNHKYFFLLLVYSAAACHFITWTMLDSVKESIDSTMPFASMFAILFGETLAAFLGILVTCFLAFHVWLMFKGMTTIEYCEKGKGGRSPYDRGIGGNVRAVLGDNPLLWCLPLGPPSKRGLYYMGEEEDVEHDMDLTATQPLRDLEGNRGTGKRRPRSSQKLGRETRRGCGYDDGAPAGFSDPFLAHAETSVRAALERNYGGGYGAVGAVDLGFAAKQQRRPRELWSKEDCVC